MLDGGREEEMCGVGGWAGSTASTHCAQSPFFFTPSYLACFYPPPHPTTAPSPGSSTSTQLHGNTLHTKSSYFLFYFYFPSYHHISAFSTSSCSLRYISLLISFVRSLPPSLSRAPPTRRLEPLRVSVTSLTRSFPIDIPTFPCTFPPHARGVYPPTTLQSPYFLFIHA